MNICREKRKKSKNEAEEDCEVIEKGREEEK